METRDQRRTAGAWGFAMAIPVALGLVVAAAATLVSPVSAEPRHGIAMHGDLKYGPDFRHFAYADPAAPKGGRVAWGVVGSFDSLNPFIVKGNPAIGLRDGTRGTNVYESLLERSYDEPFALYGLLAESVEVPADRTWVEFTLREGARFTDGDPVDVEDVVHSFELLRDKGRPNTRTYYVKVDRIERTGPRKVRFVFKDGLDKELPLILGLMPILPKHRMSAEAFERTSLEPPVGSGPYVVAEVDPGAKIVLKRDPGYWGKDLPVRRGLDNFDEIRIEYFREQSAMLEAFKTGAIDVMPESDPTRWATGYDFPAVQDGRVVKDTFRSALPRGMYGLVFNTRRPIFKDARVREALGRLFDFEFANASLFFGLQRRTASYFEGSELSSIGVPASEREKALLAPFPNAVRADVLAGTWRPPATDGSGRDRSQPRAALDQLKAAGWKLDGQQMRDATGAPVRIELLVQTRDHERIGLAYQRGLRALGIDLAIRTVDAAQFQQRRQTFDYDMTPVTWGASLSPGNEQLFRWSQASAEQEGSFNFAGAKEPAIDAMIEAMLKAEDRASFVDAVRALDRVLLSGFYVVPLFHLPEQWMARWTRISRPETPSLWGAVPAAWWATPGATR